MMMGEGALRAPCCRWRTRARPGRGSAEPRAPGVKAARAARTRGCIRNQHEPTGRAGLCCAPCRRPTRLRTCRRRGRCRRPCRGACRTPSRPAPGTDQPHNGQREPRTRRARWELRSRGALDVLRTRRRWRTAGGPCRASVHSRSRLSTSWARERVHLTPPSRA